MKPMNIAERNGAFWRFLLFFLITIALVVTVVVFSMDVPFRDSEKMRQQVFDLQRQSTLSASFNTALKAAMDELYNYNPLQDNPMQKKLLVNKKIDVLVGQLRQLPPSESIIYELIVQNLTDLNEAKAKLRQAKYE